MAVDLQTFTADSFTSTFTTIYRPPQIEKTSEPFGMLYHRESGGDDPVLDGSGVGDTAQLNLIFPLTPGFIYRLHRFQVQIIHGQNNWAEQGFFSVFLTPPGIGLPGNTTLISYPINRALIAASVPGTETSCLVTLGGGTGLSTTASTGQVTNPGVNPIGDIPLIEAVETAGGLQPVLTVASPGTNIGAGTFSYWAEWLMYRVEQGNHSGLFWPVPTT